MAVPQFAPVNIDGFDATGYQNAMTAGRQQGLQDRTAKAAAGMANAMASGDAPGAMQAAAASGDPALIAHAQNMAQQQQQTDMQRQQYEDQRSQRQLAAFGNAALAADTPAKYANLVASYEQLHGHPMDAQYHDPVNGRALVLGMTGLGDEPLKRQLLQTQIAAQNQSIAASKANMDRTKYAVNPQTGQLFDTATGDPKPLAPGEVSANPGQGLTGEDFLATLPANDATMARKIANGEIPVPGGFALTKPYWQRIIGNAIQYKPDMNAGDFGTAYATRKDFDSGKSAASVASLNTAIQHLDRLDHTIDGLNNGSYYGANEVTQSVAPYLGDTTKTTAMRKFQVAQHAVADELTAAFSNSGGNLTEVQGWQKAINMADSPQALKGATGEAINLLEGRLSALAEKKNKGLRQAQEPASLLDPKALVILNRLKVRLGLPIDASAPDGQGQPTGQGGIIFKGQTRVSPETDPLLKEAADAIAKGANPADVQLELQRRGYTIQAAPPAQPAGAP